MSDTDHNSDHDTDTEKQDQHCPSCRRELLEALYQLNITAKEYARSASDAYQNRRKAAARLYSIRKEALYQLKDIILTSYVAGGCVDIQEIERHTINGSDYYCLPVGDFSFHSPVDQWERELAPAEQASNIESFRSDPDEREDLLPEQTALSRLSEAFKSPNHYLDQIFIETTAGIEFTGWGYLDGAVQEGDRVERSLSDYISINDEYLFAVGDRFETERGTVEIEDRYHAWLTPRHDRSPVSPRIVYDLTLDGEPKETVRQYEITREWTVLIETPNDPLPEVDGRQADLLGSKLDDIRFAPGDTVEISHRNVNGSKEFKIESIWIDSVIPYCSLYPVEGGPDDSIVRSVNEVSDDLEAISSS